MVKLIPIWALCSTLAITNRDFVSMGTEPAPIIYSKSNTELVVTFEKFSSKQREELLQSLTGINGVKVLGSCEKLRCFYFSFDPSVYVSEESAFEAIQLKTRIFQPLLKSGTTVQDVERACVK